MSEVAKHTKQQIWIQRLGQVKARSNFGRLAGAMGTVAAKET